MTRYRACWYSETGELTIERLDPDAELALEDFHRGIAGPVEVLAHFASRAELESALGGWPNAAPDQPRTVGMLRELTRAQALSAVPDTWRQPRPAGRSDHDGPRRSGRRGRWRPGTS